MSVLKSTKAVVLLLFVLFGSTEATTLTIKLDNDAGVTLVGAISRWDADGNPRQKVDPNAKINQPRVDAKAKRAAPGRWVFDDLPHGRYDLVILTGERVRVEGFDYPPVLEFDPFFPPDVKTTNEARELITDDIKKARHYENKVDPLALGGDEKTVRVLMMLLRDLPTSYTPGAGTLRFEVWQYTWNYGAWVKERRTRVLHRVILPVAELRQWTWAWDARLGGIVVADKPVTLEYRLPDAAALKKLPGLRPY
ncbi:MAG: hypothetical protein JW809_04630 [Pirellulales bacterium]|nr:hypothetical protein [Pirellulales bacterium]